MSDTDIKSIEQWYLLNLNELALIDKTVAGRMMRNKLMVIHTSNQFGKSSINLNLINTWIGQNCSCLVGYSSGYTDLTLYFEHPDEMMLFKLSFKPGDVTGAEC